MQLSASIIIRSEILNFKISHLLGNITQSQLLHVQFRKFIMERQRNCNRRRSLSPSGCEVTVYHNGAVPSTCINDGQGMFVQLSASAMSLLMAFWNVAKLPVRKLDFDAKATSCTKRHCKHLTCLEQGDTKGELVPLELAMSPGYIGNGWMTSRTTEDIQWISETELCQTWDCTKDESLCISRRRF